MSEWNMDPGTTTTRARVSEVFGGGTQGGIQTSTRTANVFIYSDPPAGKQHGYDFDGFGSDGAYYYTGQGQHGDQSFMRGNSAILEHSADGNALRLFEAKGGKRAGGKQQVYLGEFVVDELDPYRTERARDSEGHDREVIVFRLLPTDAVVALSASTPALTPSRPAVVTRISPEENINTSFVVRTAEREHLAQRHEAHLMTSLERLLSANGHECYRWRIKPPGETTQLITDTYDATAGELFEIKPASTRDRVREAVAQLLDYRRHLPSGTKCTVLVPVTPSEDLCDLVRVSGLHLAVLAEGELTRH